MPIDLSRILKKSENRKTNGLDPNASTVNLVDRVALRKSWQRKGATYWVDILRDTVTNETQVHRSWRFLREGEWVEGTIKSNHPTENGAFTVHAFQQFVLKQLEKDYVIAERRTSAQSPAWNVKFNTSQEDVNPEKEEVAPAIQRKKGTHDWW